MSEWFNLNYQFFITRKTRSHVIRKQAFRLFGSSRTMEVRDVWRLLTFNLSAEENWLLDLHMLFCQNVLTNWLFKPACSHP